MKENDQKSTKRVGLRMNSKDYMMLQTAAKGAGKTISGYILDALRRSYTDEKSKK